MFDLEQCYGHKKNAKNLSLFTEKIVSLLAIPSSEHYTEDFQNPWNSPKHLLLYLAAKPDKVITTENNSQWFRGLELF